MNKKLLTSLIVAGTLTLSLTACAPNQTSNAFALKDTTDVYAYSAVSAMTVLSDLSGETVALANSTQDQTVKSLFANGAEQGEGRYQDYVNSVNKYMAIAENLISANGFAFEKVESDRVEYTDKIAVTYADMSNQTLSYALYYNVTSEYVDRDGEKEIDVAGVFVNGEKEYEIVGNQELEDDENEIELIIKVDAQNYVVVEYETERDEKEYAYSIYQDGRLVERTAFEQESNFLGGNEVEIEIVKGGKTTVFELEEREERGQKYIKGNVLENGESFSFKIMVTVDEQTGESAYEYVFGESRFNRLRNGHHHGRLPHFHR